MLPYRRLVPTLFFVAKPVTGPSNVVRRRGLIFSAPRRATPPPTPPTTPTTPTTPPPTPPTPPPTTVDAEEQAAVAGNAEFANVISQQRGDDTGPASYRQFLEEIGYKYKFASPRLWIGNEVPFPMNPSFKPPPPISDKQRETIYRLYWLNPRRYNIRKLSKIFNISLSRVTAILRLKSLEKNWIKEGKELQTGFRFGMERLLKAQTHNAVKPLQKSLRHKFLETLDVHDARSDVHKADLLAQKEQQEKVDYEQLYWETIPEGSQEPILPISLQEAQKTAISKKKIREAKANAKFMHRIPDTEFIKTPVYKVLTLTRQSRPTTRFVNVGSAFMNARELVKRQVVSQRKSRIRARKNLEKKARYSRE